MRSETKTWLTPRFVQDGMCGRSTDTVPSFPRRFHQNRTSSATLTNPLDATAKSNFPDREDTGSDAADTGRTL